MKSSNSGKNSKERRFAKEFFAFLTSSAGRSKDDFLQIVSRECGLALAALMKDPLTKIIKDNKFQITVELIPKKALTKSKRKTQKDKK